MTMGVQPGAVWQELCLRVCYLMLGPYHSGVISGHPLLVSPVWCYETLSSVLPLYHFKISTISLSVQFCSCMYNTVSLHLLDLVHLNSIELVS